MITLPKWHYPT